MFNQTCFCQYVGTEFICAVQPILKDKWTPELEDAWKVWLLHLLSLSQDLLVSFPTLITHIRFRHMDMAHVKVKMTLAIIKLLRHA